MNQKIETLEQNILQISDVVHKEEMDRNTRRELQKDLESMYHLLNTVLYENQCKITEAYED